LLAEMATHSGGRLFVLSDPDLIANHGLARGDNAGRALGLLSRIPGAGQTVVVDETLHGFEQTPSLWRELFVFPLLSATLQGLLALLMLVWSGLGRFGAPMPTSSTHASGRALLIENTAALLGSAGHSAHSLARYLDVTIGDLAQTPARAHAGDGRHSHGLADRGGAPTRRRPGPRRDQGTSRPPFRDRSSLTRRDLGRGARHPRLEEGDASWTRRSSRTLENA